MRYWAALVADVVCVLVFAAVGRASHAEDVGALGLAATAWPFLVGCLVGSVVAAVRGAGAYGLVSGLLVWVDTVVLGMILRAVTGAGVQWSFVVVAAVVLAVFLLGWRGVRSLVGRAQARRLGTDGPGPRSGGRVGEPGEAHDAGFR